MEPHIAGASKRERNASPLGSDLCNVLLAHQAVGNALGQLRTAARNAGESNYERFADSLIRSASKAEQELHRGDMAVATCIERSMGPRRCSTPSK